MKEIQFVVGATLAIAGVCGVGRAADMPPGRIAFGSCAQPRVAQPVWTSIMKAKPGLFLFSGDNIYASGRNADELDELYALLARNGSFFELRKSVPILATWDDHDYGPNDAGVESPIKSEAKAAFLEFFEVPADSPRRSREGIYDSALFEAGGRRLQVLLLDTRWFRSGLTVLPAAQRVDKGKYGPSADPGATILGAEQWAWLADELSKPADLRIVVSSIQFVSDQHGFEKWANFPKERQRLLDLLCEKNASGVIMVSGDRHFSEISAMKPEETCLGYQLLDVTASALNQAGSLYAEPNSHRIGDEGYGLPNFGFLEIAWSAKDPGIAISIRDAITGDAVITHSTSLSNLQIQSPK
jgi:alkaline phosphatase D